MSNRKILRRRILIVAGKTAAPGEHTMCADVEDNQHRFGITLRHDGTQVLAVEVDARHMRHPWTECNGAVAQLPRLVGMALTPHPLGAYRHTRGAEQCTHMFDLANLAIAHAARGTARRQWDVEVVCTDFRSERHDRGFRLLGSRHLKLYRDDALVLEWPMDADNIVGGQHAGQNVRTMMAWVEQHVTDPEEIEAITVARRTLIVSTSLTFDMDKLADFPVANSSRVGACYAYQPGVVETLTPLRGNSRDFAARPEALLADLKINETR